MKPSKFQVKLSDAIVAVPPMCRSGESSTRAFASGAADRMANWPGSYSLRAARMATWPGGCGLASRRILTCGSAAHT